MGLAAVTQARIAGIAVRNQKMKSKEYEPVSRIRKSKKENPLASKELNVILIHTYYHYNHDLIIQ